MPFDWVNRVRGEYHSTRLIENTAQHVFKIFKALLLILLPACAECRWYRTCFGGLSALNSAIQAQQSVLVISDQYLILADLLQFYLSLW